MTTAVETLQLTTRQMEIVHAAGAILTRSGINGLTIKNLASEMKFSEGALYRHFSTKEDVIVAMLEFLSTSMDARLASVVSKQNGVKENFLLLFKSQLDFFADNKHFIVVVFSDGLLEQSEKINSEILKLMSVKTRHLLPILKKGQSEEIFVRTITANEMLHIVIGSFRLMMYKWRVSEFSFDLRKQGNATVVSILRLIETP